jgi:Zn-dependent peptidase ImmA (M78 family)
MSQRSGVRLSPSEYARELLLRLDVGSVPIYPRKIAKELGIYVQERKAESGYDGYLMCADGTWGIMINSSIRSRARKRFTVAHELGHYCINHHKGSNYRCFRKDIDAVDPSARQDEREANEFAVELLMPDRFFRADIQQRGVSLETINDLATRYGTSMTSTAIRYARFSPCACAVVLSEQGKIKYFSYSEGFRKMKCLYLSRNVPLRDGSCAKELFDAGLHKSEKRGEVTASAWSARVIDPEMTILEHSRCLPAFNQVLSLIWFSEKKRNTSQQIAHVLVE